MTQTVGSYLVDLMIRSGVRNIYGIVGDSANPVIDAIRKSDGKLKFINVRNEEAGAFAAGADSQVSGRPTAVIGSSGPGSLHLLNGLYDCARNGATVFAIATHIPTTEIGTNYFQETRPDQIFPDCTKYIGYVTSAAQMPRIAELAMQAAILERGVGMIILPGDVSAAPIEHSMLEHPIATERSRVRPPDRDLDRVADLIAKSGRIVIFGGAGCVEARAEVLQLSQLLNAPVGFTFRGKDILEADNPNAVGMTGLLGWGGAHTAIAECDLLLMLGTDFPYHPFMPEKSTIIQIDEQSGHLGRRAKVDVGLVGDVGETLKALLPRLLQRADREFLDKILVETRKTGAAKTLFGRIRPIPEISSPQAQLRSFAERTALNSPLQGTAADLIKLAMISIDRRLSAEKFEAKMILQVHDELLFEAPPKEKSKLEKLVRQEMEGVYKLAVPLVVGICSGSNWRDLE